MYFIDNGKVSGFAYCCLQALSENEKYPWETPEDFKKMEQKYNTQAGWEREGTYELHSPASTLSQRAGPDSASQRPSGTLWGSAFESQQR